MSIFKAKKAPAVIAAADMPQVAVPVAPSAPNVNKPVTSVVGGTDHVQVQTTDYSKELAAIIGAFTNGGGARKEQSPLLPEAPPQEQDKIPQMERYRMRKERLIAERQQRTILNIGG